MISEIKKKLSHLRKKYNLSDKEVENLLSEDEYIIPVSIFASGLSPLESLVKYLKENYGLNYHRIGLLLNRDERTIWLTYNNSVKKKRVPLSLGKTEIWLNLEIFSERKFSVLESLCIILTEKYSMKIRDIAELLKKNPSAIWTVFKRALKKKK